MSASAIAQTDVRGLVTQNQKLAGLSATATASLPIAPPCARPAPAKPASEAPGPPQGQPEPFAPLRETAVGEGNILEHPLFKLSNHEARPTRGVDGDGRKLLAQEDYTSIHAVAPGSRIIINADMHEGYPTVFGMRVLLAVIDRSRELGYPDRRVPMTYTDFASRLGIPDFGGRDQKRIKQALLALTGMTIMFENAWYDKATRTKLLTTGAEHLITTLRLTGRASRLALGHDDEDFIELGERLFSSLRAGYRIGIDFHYLNNLEIPTAQRLYAYLTKKDGHGTFAFTEDLFALAAKLPLSSRYRSQIRRSLEPALLELVEPKPNGQHFLSAFAFERSNLTVHFAGTSLRDTVRALTAKAGPSVRAPLLPHASP